MKRTIYSLLALLITASLFFAACTKEDPDVKLDPKLSTSQLSNITSDGATVVGFVVAQGSGFTERGICYNTATAPTVANLKTAYTGEATGATFEVTLKGLAYATKYYARAYATDDAGTTIYGEEYNFTTLPVVPELATAPVVSITGNSASSGGIVTVPGGAAVTVQGVCWSESPAPTIANSKTANGNGTGAFVSALTGLKGNTMYYVRAYATNSAGTGYGPQVMFVTLVDVPAVTTTAVTAITKVSAVSGGNVTYDGGGTVTARGLVWSLNANPTLTDTKIAGGTGTGSFVSNITGLTKFTTYHVRAFATNSAGTAYGADLSFTTLADILTWNIPGNYVAASYPGSTYADWSPDKSPQVISTIAAPDKLEGYVYMSGTANEWKFATKPNWDGPNYGSGATAGSLDASGPNISSPAGYYKINVDATALTYTAVNTVWGVIGAATPGGWDNSTALTYQPASRTWTGGVHLTVNEFKFRANNGWDINYGSTAGNSTLNAGGNNIPNTLEADYFFTLDLSHPNAYTYSANRWGLIGAATPGGWDTDQNMTWDNTLKAFKVTVNLTAGEMKFRANDGWDINLGGDINALTPGGANIAVATAGNYTITLWLNGTPHCTIVKN